MDRLLTDEEIETAIDCDIDMLAVEEIEDIKEALKAQAKVTKDETLKAVGEWIINLKYLPVKYPFKSDEIGIELLEGEEGGIVYFPLDVLEEVVHEYLGGEMPEL